MNFDIFIYGTNDGFRPLFSSDKDKSGKIADDKRLIDFFIEIKIGNSAYSISFLGDGIVYTKYLLVCDSIPKIRNGFIAFAVFFEFGKILTGSQILKLIDELAARYKHEYIVDHKLNRGDSSNYIREEWDFIDKIGSKYTDFGTLPYNSLRLSREKNATYVIYDSKAELEEYFEKPFQKEYFDFKEIFFFDKSLENALPSSSKLLKPDMSNPYYFFTNLKGYNRNLEVKAGGEDMYKRTPIPYIRGKEEIELTYTKDKDFYKTFKVSGKLDDYKLDKYLKKEDGNLLRIQSDEIFESDIEEKEKTITFTLKDYNSNPISESGAKIEFFKKSEFGEKEKLSDNSLRRTFKGEDLGKKWTVSVYKTDEFYIKDFPLTLQNYSNNQTVDIQLNEYKTIEIIGKNGNEQHKLNKSNVNINYGEYVDNGKYRFKNDEITKRCNVSVSIIDDNYKLEGNKNFTPKEIKESVKVNLDKIKPYKVEAGAHGKFSPPSDLGHYLTYDKEAIQSGKSGDEDEYEWVIKSNFGWKFTKFEESHDESGDYEGVLTAHYKSRKTFFLTSIITLLLLGGGIYFGITSHKLLKKYEDSRTAIDNYVRGDVLKVEELREYSEKWKPLNPSEEPKLSTWVLSKINENYTTQEWSHLNEKINSAISFRELLDSLDFNKLKQHEKDYLSDSQKKLIAAVNKLDTTAYDSIREKLKDEIFDYPLTRITDSLESSLVRAALPSPKKSEDEVIETPKDSPPIDDPATTDTQVAKKESPKADQATEKISETPPKSTRLANENNNNNRPEPTGTDLRAQLKSSTITKQELRELRELKNSEEYKKYKPSIDIYLEFWEKIEPKEIEKSTFVNLKNKTKNDKNLRGSQLYKLLDKITKDDEAFENFKAVPGRATKPSLNDLKKSMNK